MTDKNLIYKATNFLLNLNSSETITGICFSDIECRNSVRSFNLNFPLSFVINSLVLLKQNFKDDDLYKEYTLKINKKLNKLLRNLKQQGKNFSFNYFLNNPNKLKNEFILPDDIDDTALCLSALINSGNNINPNFFIKIIQLESTTGGPYKTWYINSDVKDTKNIWKDIDPIVNANLLYLCSLLNIKLPRTLHFIVESLNKKNISSPYYPTTLYFYYYLSKYIKQTSNLKLKQIVLTQLTTFKFKFLNKGEKILYGLSLNYLDTTLLKNEIEEIIGYQNEDGSIDEIPFCYDFIFKHKATYTSNKAFSSALWLELILLENNAFNLKGSLDNKDKKNKNSSFINLVQDNIIYELEKSKFKKLVLKKFPLKNKFSAILLPYTIATSLKSRLNNNEINNIVHLTTGIYFGWVGYTLLDHTVDMQKYSLDILLIPYCLRIHQEYISKSYAKFPDILKELNISWNITDYNYFWEATKCKFSNLSNEKIRKNLTYKYIENRMKAFNIIVKNVIFLLKLNPSINVKTLSNKLYEIIKNMMIIDQLNDDAHDWKKDMKDGIYTLVTIDLLKTNLNGKELNSYFWNHTIDKIIKIASSFYKKSLIELNSNIFINQDLENILEKKFLPIKQVKHNINDFKKVLNHYSSK